MKVRGVIVGASRLPGDLENCRQTLHIVLLDGEASVGKLDLPVSDYFYESFAKNAVNGPFEIEFHLNFDKPAPS